MNESLKKKMDELADKRSKRQCSTGNDYLDKAISWYLKIGFEDGFTACHDEMQAQEFFLAKDDCYYWTPEHSKEIKNLKENTKILVEALKDAQTRFRVTQSYVPIGEEHIATLLTMARIDEALAKFRGEK